MQIRSLQEQRAARQLQETLLPCACYQEALQTYLRPMSQQPAGLVNGKGLLHVMSSNQHEARREHHPFQPTDLVAKSAATHGLQGFYTTIPNLYKNHLFQLSISEQNTPLSMASSPDSCLGKALNIHKMAWHDQRPFHRGVCSIISGFKGVANPYLA